MSPEQARGRKVDRRADVWAFGVLLWEMLTGRRMFLGETVSDTLAAVLTKDPDFAALPPQTPPRVRWILERCLERDAKKRLRDIGEARVLLAEPEMFPRATVDIPAATTSGVPAHWKWFASALLIGVLGLAAGLFIRSPAPADPLYVRVPLPPDTRLALTGIQPGPPAISPDGKKIAFAADGAPGERNLWVRDLHEAGARMIQNTAGASYPFWSPDGRDIGFFADSKLKRVSSTGGSVVTLADAPSGKGGSWNRDGTILFCPSFNAPLYKIPASGGVEAEQVTTLEMDRGDASHRFPQFMDDGNHFIYLVRNRDEERSEVLHGALDRESSSLVVKTETNAYVVDDTIFYLKDRMLMAHDFDQETGQISGVPIPIAEGVRRIEGAGGMVVAAGDGALVYQTGDLTTVRQFVWLDRSGNRLGTLGEAVFLADGSSPSVSPDGNRIAFSDDRLWIMEVSTGNRERITFADGIQMKPVWSPDGRTIAYASNESGPYQILGKDLENGSETTVLVANDDPEFRPWPEDWI